MSKSKEFSKPLTAAELDVVLNQDPEYLRRKGEREKHLRALEERFARAELPLVEALRDIGITAKSVWDLVNARQAYPSAIPILIEHLKRPYPFRIREGIARALTVKDAGEAAYLALVDEFKAQTDSADAGQHGFKWALGNAISIVATKNHFDEIAELIRDKRHGTTRDMMVLRLSSLDRNRAVNLLIEALNDDEISGQAIVALGKLKSQKARIGIEYVLAHHPQPWVRKAAKKALAKLNK
jgi:hypothetical protein